jgi:hypothetical protein
MNTLNLNQEVFNNLRTGDLILFNSNEPSYEGWIDYFLKFFTHSEYTHVGMIIRQSRIGFRELEEDKIYLWESGVEKKNNKNKVGVQLTDLNEMIENYRGKLYVRKLDCSDKESKRIFNSEILNKIFSQANGKPYDYNIIDWLSAFCRTDIRPQKTDRFWCSAFVGYIYTQCYILNGTTDWSILRPCDFSIEDKDQHLKYNSIYKLEEKQTLLYYKN